MQITGGKLPASIVFAATLWFSMSVPWWTLLSRRLGRVDEGSREAERRFRMGLWTYASISALTGAALIPTYLIV